MNNENKTAEEQATPTLAEPTEPPAVPEVPDQAEGNTDAPDEKEGDGEAEKAE